MEHENLKISNYIESDIEYYPEISNNSNIKAKKGSLLSWALIFLIIAIIAAVFGFSGIAGTAAWVAKILFVIFLILFIVSIIKHYI
ncbi:DUF1328 domain-containing protein [Candidatus Woesearchaeota archaeon]|nr:DUF1328 domain-containing protein [Candidatus Woesearchaeota archaeon]